MHMTISLQPCQLLSSLCTSKCDIETANEVYRILVLLVSVYCYVHNLYIRIILLYLIIFLSFLIVICTG